MDYISSVINCKDILNIIKNISSKISENNIVKNTSDNFSKLIPIFHGTYSKELKIIFNPENLEEIKNLFEKESQYDLKNILMEFIKNQCLESKIPEKDSQNIAENFYEVFLQEIQMNFSEIYEKVKIGEKIIVINDTLKNISTKIDTILEVKYLTIRETEDNLKNMLIKGEKEVEGSTLNFFDYEDKNFYELLTKRLKNNGTDTLYIEGPSREEVFYNILYVIKKENFEKKTLIIESIEEWKKLPKEKNIKNKILIANFYDDEINSVSENITVFIFGKEEKCQHKERIILERRLARNLREKLERLGYSYSQINNILRKTSGVYSGVKREIFSKRFNAPKWTGYLKEKQTCDVMKIAVLLGEWTNMDKIGIEEKFKINYNEFIRELKKFSNTEEPLIIESQGNYFLACPEESIVYIEDYLIEKDYETFSNIVIEIITEIEEEFIKYFNSQYPIYDARKYKYSEELKNGLLRTLILFCLNDKKSYYAEKVVNTIMNNIIRKEELDDELKWDYLSNYIRSLCEISPKAVLEKLEEEIEKNKLDEGVLKLFSKEKKNDFFEKNSYISFLWTIEYLLQIENLSRRAIQLLFKINDLDIKYKSNSPAMTLRQVFCVWMRDIKMLKEDILKLAEYYIKNYKSGWEIIKKEIPKDHDTMVGDLAKPKYLNYLKNKEVIKREEREYLAKGYVNLCINYVEEKGEILELLIINFIKKFSYYGVFEIFKEKLKNCIESSNDEAKKKIQDKLRGIIYENRFFERGLEDEELEKIYLSIEYINPIQGYRYLFDENIHNFPLIAPVKYKEEDYHNKNQKKVLDFIEREIKKFKYKNCSYLELLSLGVKNSFLLGSYIFKIFSKGKLKTEELKELLKISDKNEAYLGYSREIFQNEGLDGLKKILQEAKNLKVNDDIKVNLLLFENLNLEQNTKPLIEIYPDLKEKYWQKMQCVIIENKETAEYIIENFVKYQNPNLMIKLYENKSYFSFEELVDYLIKIKEKVSVLNGDMECFYLENILKKIYDEFLQESSIDEEYHKIAEIELYFSPVLSINELKCFLYLLKKNPNCYCEILKCTYKQKVNGKNIETDLPNKNLKNISNLEYNLKFCPCTHINDKINSDEIEKWCDDFKQILKSNNQEYLYEIKLGKLFAHSPKGEDGYYPHESVRNIIEKMSGESLKELQRNYEIEIRNKRGCYTTAKEGKEEEELAEINKNNAEGIKLISPKTADIYFSISNIYRRESQQLREKAVYG